MNAILPTIVDMDVEHPYLLYLQQELEQTKANLRYTEAQLQSSLTAGAGRNELSLEDKDSYRAVVDSQLDLICRFDADYRLTFANQPYANLYGKSPDALLGQSILEGIPPEYQRQVIAHIFSLTTQNPVSTDENPTCLVDGSMRWFHWTNRLIELPDGTVEYQAVGRDITDRKNAEDVERQQRQRAESMRDSLVALTSSLDIEQVMTQILASAAIVVVSDASRIWMVEKDYTRIAYTRGYSQEAIAWFSTHRFGLDSSSTANAFPVQRAYRVADTQQEADWISFPPIQWVRSSIGVPITVQGEVIGVLVVDSAIPNFFQSEDMKTLQILAYYASLALTNAYQAARLEQRIIQHTSELQVSEAKFRRLFDNAPIPIIISNQAGRITSVNHEAEVLFGYQATELLHQLVEILMPNNIRAAHIHNWMNNATHKRIRKMSSGLKLLAQRKNGSKIPVEIQLGYIESADEFFVISFILESTEHKKSQGSN